MRRYANSHCSRTEGICGVRVSKIEEGNCGVCASKAEASLRRQVEDFCLCKCFALFLQRRTPHPRVAAPRFRITSWQVLRRLAKVDFATRFARLERSISRTRAFRAVFCKGGRFARRSAKSFSLKRARSHAQNFSTGLRSGERGGNCHKRTRARRCAALL